MVDPYNVDELVHLGWDRHVAEAAAKAMRELTQAMAPIEAEPRLVGSSDIHFDPSPLSGTTTNQIMEFRERR